MFGYLVTVCFTITFLSYCKGSNISDQRLCYDPDCNEPLSLAKTLLKYVKSYDGGLSFQPGAEIVIYSKSAGSRPELWGAEVGGKRGYIPKEMVREIKVFHPDETLKYTVPTISSGEPKKRDTDIEKEEGSAETVQEKPVDVTINENPVNAKSESSVKESFDVIDGTTIYADVLGMATPTVNPLDSNSMGMSKVPIESTTSFIATSDMSMASMTHSDMAPISPTTMMEKSEEQRVNVEDVGKSSEEMAGMVESVLNMVSELVSGGEQDVSGKNSKQAKDEKGNGNDQDAYDGVGSKAPETDGSKVETEEKVDEIPQDDAEDLMGDEDEEDDVEDEEEGDDGDDEDEDDLEPGESGEDVDNTTTEMDDLIDGKSSVEKEETTSDVAAPEHVDEVEPRLSAPISSLEEAELSVDHDKNGSPIEQKDKNEDSDGEMMSASSVPPSAGSHSNETPLLDKKYDSFSSDDTGLHESENFESTMTLDVNDLSKPTEVGESKTFDFDQQSNSSTLGIEAPQQVKDHSDTASGEDANQDQSNGNKGLGDIMPESSVKTQETHIVVPVVSLEAPEKENSKSLISGDQNEELSINAVTPNGAPENSVSTERTPASDNQFSEPSFQTEPSGVVGDEYSSHLGPSDIQTLGGKEIEEVGNPTTPLTGENSDLQVEPSILSTREHDSTTESSDMKTEEAAEKNIDARVDELLPHRALEINLSMEPNASSEVKESESTKSDVVIESPGASVTENHLPISEDSSSGIFSAWFNSLGFGYEFVSSIILGNSDKHLEGIEGQEGSTQGVPHISVDKYINSEHNHSPVEDAQNLAAGGESVFGGNFNSYCDESSEKMCGEQSTASPSNAITSNGGQNSEDNEASSSWIGLPNFFVGNDSSGMFNYSVPSYGAMIYSFITGVIVLCFFLGYYFIEGNRRDVILLAKINALEKKLTVSSKECLILKEKLKQFEIKSSDFDDSAEVIHSMKIELEKIQNEKAQLEKELEATTEAGLEMEHMVSQFLSSQQDSKSLMDSIEQLQMQANKQQAKISSLENSLVAKTQENERLAQELGVTESKVQDLEEDLKQVSENLLQRDEEHSKRYSELKELNDIQHNKFLEDVKNKTIETEMALTRCKSLETTLSEMKEMLTVKENEIIVLQECLQQLKTSNGDDPDKAEDQLKDILNFGKLKAELTAITKERDSLKEKLQGEEDARRLLEDHVEVIREEVEKLRKCHEAAEREKVEAQTRLEVLSSYFKEKESQLQKELGNKEALWIQKHADTSTVMQRMKSLEEEVENYKSQNETLKKEILDQERGYKTQVATIEKKAHENWVAARQAERKLEESKQEASQLRNRLTMADKTNPNSTSQNGDDSKPNLSMIDSNGELSASPLHLGLASNSSVDMLLSDPHPHYLDPNSSPPHVGGGGRLPPPPLLPPPPFPPMPLPPRSPYHHPLSPPVPFMPLPPPDANLYPSSIDGHRPPPLGRMSSPPPAPSPSQSPHLPPNDSRGGEFPSPYRDRGGGGRPSSPSRLYMPPDDRGLGEEWRMGRYCTPPPHPGHPSDFPIPPYPPRPHWEDEPPHPTSSFRPLPTSQRTDSHRELKGNRSKGSHTSESDSLEKSSRHGGKL